MTARTTMDLDTTDLDQLEAPEAAADEGGRLHAGDAVAAVASATADAVRSTAEMVRTTADEGRRRLPRALDTLRDGALAGVAAAGSWPDPTRRIAAGVSVGLALGLTIAGAPRLLAAAALIPAIGLAGSARPATPAAEG